MNRSKYIYTAALVLSCSQYGHANPYETLAEFLANTKGVTTIGFEDIAYPYSFAAAPTLTLGGVTFTTPGGKVVDSLYATTYNWGSGASLYSLGNGKGGEVTVALPSGVTAIGADLWTFEDGLNVNLTLCTGDSFTVQTGGQPALAFFGVTTTSDIVSVTFNVPDGYLGLDNFVYGTTKIPDAGSTMALFGIGALGLATIRRRLV